MDWVKAFFAGYYRQLTGKGKPFLDRVGAAIMLLLPFLIVVALIYVAWWAAPTVLAVLALLYLLFGDSIERRNMAENQAAYANTAALEAAWQELAVRVIVPIFRTFFGGVLEPIDLVYHGSAVFGAGLYFMTPASLADDDQRRQLRRKIAFRLAALCGLQPAQLLRDGIVRVGSDFVFIRSDDFVIQSALTSVQQF